MAIESIGFHPAEPVRATHAPKVQAQEGLDVPLTSKALVEPKDLAYFSQRLKEHKPTPGLSTPVDPTAKIPEAGTLKIGTVPPSLQRYDLCKRNAADGVIDDYFFYLDSSSIKEEAEALLKGEDFDPDSINSRCFVRGLCEWFEGSDQGAVSESLGKLVQEYASELKKGSNPDISLMQTKFTLAGEEVTIGQIFEMRDVALAIKDLDYGSSVGTSNLATFAKKGLMEAAAKKYSSSLPSGLGKAFENRFTQMVEKNKVSTMQQWNNDEYLNGRITGGFHDFLTESADFAYKLFSESDMTSADLSNRVSQMMTYATNSGYYQSQALKRFTEILSAACQSAQDSFS